MEESFGETSPSSSEAHEELPPGPAEYLLVHRTIRAHPDEMDGCEPERFRGASNRVLHRRRPGRQGARAGAEKRPLAASE